MKIVTSSFNECCPLEKVKIIKLKHTRLVYQRIEGRYEKERRNV